MLKFRFGPSPLEGEDCWTYHAGTRARGKTCDLAQGAPHPPSASSLVTLAPRSSRGFLVQPDPSGATELVSRASGPRTVPGVGSRGAQLPAPSGAWGPSPGGPFPAPVSPSQARPVVVCL